MTKRMGNLGKLSQLSGIKKSQTSHLTINNTSLELKSDVSNELEDILFKESSNFDEKQTLPNHSTVDVEPTFQQTPNQHFEPKSEVKESLSRAYNISQKLVPINIKIAKSQKEWLGKKASLVRDNNTESVPPSERVFPQHLIGVAIDLLKKVDVDWNEVRNLEDLRKILNL
jgi:hypothetical protein